MDIPMTWLARVTCCDSLPRGLTSAPENEDLAVQALEHTLV